MGISGLPTHSREKVPLGVVEVRMLESALESMEGLRSQKAVPDGPVRSESCGLGGGGGVSIGLAAAGCGTKPFGGLTD